MAARSERAGKAIWRILDVRLFKPHRWKDPAFWIALVPAPFIWDQIDQSTIPASLSSNEWRAGFVSWLAVAVPVMWFLLAGLLARVARKEYEGTDGDV